MPRFAANLSMMFNELPFAERFGAAKAAGFDGVECLFPYELGADAAGAILREHKLEQALFNLPPGNWEAGERGLAALPGREADFEAALDKALSYTGPMGCKTLHAMAGIPGEGFADLARDTYVRNLKVAATRAAEQGVTIIIEPINTRDIPGYFLNYQHTALQIMDATGADNIGLQFDLYHCQIMEGDLAIHLRDLMPRIRHMQVAGVPERHEPDVGEVNYPYLFDLIDSLGYEGWVGCEYRPRAGTVEGLGWLENYRAAC